MPRTTNNTPLATLPSPTAQQVFDAVKSHAGTMTRRCTKNPNADTGGCLYRGPNETACFIGGLFTDIEARGLDALDDATVRDLAQQDRLPGRLRPHLALLIELQEVHDYKEPPAWSFYLRGVADKHGLAA